MLMVQAHLAGAIDLSRARPHDRRWWLMYGLVRQCFQRNRKLKILELLYQYRLAPTASSRLEPDQYKQLREDSWAIFNRYLSEMEPWAKVDEEEASKHELMKLRDAYVKTFGDPQSPAYQSAIEYTVQKLREKDQEQSELVTERMIQQRSQAAREVREERVRKILTNRT